MFYCNGWSLTWAVTALGATHVCLGSFDAQRALDLISRYPVTHLCGAPVVLSELAREGGRRRGRDSRALYCQNKRLVSGGRPLGRQSSSAATSHRLLSQASDRCHVGTAIPRRLHDRTLDPARSLTGPVRFCKSTLRV